MKAKYIKPNEEFKGLILGEVYDVNDVWCMKRKDGRRYGEVLKIQIKDKTGELHWYESRFFELYAEAFAYMKAATAEAHQPTLQPILKSGSVQICPNMSHAEVVACGIAAAAGIAEGIKNPDKELQKKISASIDAHICHLRMYGA